MPSPQLVRPVLEQPCERGQDHRDSDLCAQWKAADAAARAAWWAMVGTIVAGFGIIGLYWQVLLTRKAVEDTKAATEAMNEANRLIMKEAARNTRRAVASAKDTEAALKIAERNANAAAAQVEIARQVHTAQTRPWVFVKDVEIVFEHMQKANVVFFFHNFGNWPAAYFSKSIRAHQTPYPFGAEPVEVPNESLATMLPPSGTESMVVENIPRPKAGFAVRIDAAWSYDLPDGSKETERETFVVDLNMGKAGVRKMTAYDSANHPVHSKKGE